jgi:PAS domain S-box-containing protein
MARPVSPVVRYALQQLALFPLALLAAGVGATFIGGETGVSWLWPTSGLGLAALTLLGLHAAPAFFLGCLVGHANAGFALPNAFAGAIVDLLQAMLGSLMMRTWPDFRSNLSRLGDAFVFVVSAVVSSTAGSLLWAAVHCAAGLAPWPMFLTVFKTWSTGNLMGALLVAPPLLTWVRMRWMRPTPAKIVETGGLFLALAASGIIAYFGGVRGDMHSPLEYLPLPVAIWAAMRFGVQGATAATVVMASVALAGHNLFDPPGSAPPDEAEMLLVQASLAVGALTALLVGAVTTERDETMRALGESEQRATALFNHAPDAIFIMDGDRRLGRIVAANPAAADLHDIPQQELSHLWLFDLEPTMPREDLDAELRRIAEGERRRVELTHLRRDGKTVDVEMHASPIEVGGGRYLIAFNRDVTSRKRAEADRQLMELKLQETQKLESLGLLAGGIAHDFNNLLTGILGNASLAREDSGEIVEYLEQIERAAERAADLCGQMLAYAGKARFEVQAVDLSTAVDDTTALIKSSIGKNVRLVVELARDLPPVEGDQTQIRQIIMNLVLNASEAIEDRPGTIRITTGTMMASQQYLAAAHLSPDLPAGQYVYLEVADTGRGMSKSTLAKIFDPFFSTKFTGRGLGLAAVLGIVRGHHGALRVHSEEGNGSTFRLLLPAGVHAVRPEPVDESAVMPAWRGSGRALIIDDEGAVRRVATRMLQSMGFDPVAAASGPDGVQFLRERPDAFKFVLLDLTMPGVSGDETYHALRAFSPDIPVILMSGFTHQEVAARFEGQQLAGFIQKPFRGEDLRHVVRVALGPATDEHEPVLTG